MIVTSKLEAISLLRKWMEERDVIDCIVSGLGFEASFRAKVTDVSDIEVRLSTDTGVSGCVIFLDRIGRFGFAELGSRRPFPDGFLMDISLTLDRGNDEPPIVITRMVESGAVEHEP